VERLIALKIEHRIKMIDRTEQEKISDREVKGNRKGLILCENEARVPKETQYKTKTYQQT